MNYSMNQILTYLIRVDHSESQQLKEFEDKYGKTIIKPPK